MQNNTKFQERRRKDKMTKKEKRRQRKEVNKHSFDSTSILLNRNKSLQLKRDEKKRRQKDKKQLIQSFGTRGFMKKMIQKMLFWWRWKQLIISL